MDAYSDDLAYIQDAGFGDFARGAAPGVLQALRRNGVKGGLVVDLGCGSGIWAELLLAESYDVLGVDLSPGMLALARRRAPEATFLEASLHEVKLPRCAAVTALGECVNYLFDPEDVDVPAFAAGVASLRQLFARIHAALRPGGLFVFDVAEPGQVPPDQPRYRMISGAGWVIQVDVREDPKARLLTRSMIFHRLEGDCIRRGEEVHRQRLYSKKEVKEALAGAGFEVRTARAYGAVPLALAHTAFLARKPLVRHGELAKGRRISNKPR
jgi:SAM-dependent methyltransferase